MKTTNLRDALTEDIETALCEADDDAYELWLAGDDDAAEQAEVAADKLRDELARRQGLIVTHQEDIAA